jgi:hypothetical protein
MKRNKINTSTEQGTELFQASEIIRKFKFAFAGTPDKNLKGYRVAKKKVAQLLGTLSMEKSKSRSTMIKQ